MSIWTVGEEEAGRLDKFLVGKFPDKSRAELQAVIEQGRVNVGGKTVSKNSYAVESGQLVTVELPPEVHEMAASAIELPVIFEDDHLIAINKPAGLIVHPTTVEQEGTMVQALLTTHPQLREVLYDPQSPISQLRPGIVHRLDKDTSGVIVVAKTVEAMQQLASQFHNHSVTKEYVALVAGNNVEAQTVRTHIKRKPDGRMGIDLHGEGREAVTHITPLETWQIDNVAVTLAAFTIETGRTHQIRVHCKYKGFPVVGDSLYTNRQSGAIAEKLAAKRQLLHAKSLDLLHPATQQPLHFEAPLPADFNLILTKLRSADTLNPRG